MNNPYREKINYDKILQLTAAQEVMHTSFIALNRQMSTNKISVKSLCRESHVARSTFYTYYDSIDMLEDEIENILIRNLMNIHAQFSKSHPNEPMDFQYFERMYQYILQNHDVFSNFLVYQPNYKFIGKWKTVIKFYAWNQVVSKSSANNVELVLELISALIITAFSHWCVNIDDVQIDDINVLIKRLLNILDYY